MTWKVLGVVALCGLSGCQCGVSPEVLPPAGDDAGSDAGQPDAAVSLVDAGADGGGGTFVDAGQGDAGPPGPTPVDGGHALSCSACHGGPDSDAPPRDIDGGSSTTLTSVGAHQSHLQGTGWHRDVLCGDCHVVPSSVDADGHIDPSPAEIVFGPVGRANNTPAAFDGTACTGWCHGSGLTGGILTAPVWTKADRTQAYCGTCHGVPPPLPHPQVAPTSCTGCHPNAGPDLNFSDPQRHIDGVVDLELTCTSCHGSTNPAPPKDLTGATATTARGVGAHQKHLGTSLWHREVLCADCHVVPSRADDPGHLDSSPADLTWGALARASGAAPSFDGGTCSVYCHGATIAGGADREPRWTQVDGTQAACGSCHGSPPPAPHPSQTSCQICHPTMRSPVDFAQPAKHIDGVVDVSMACDSCHGGNGAPAPPKDLAGSNSTAARGVGAHQSHLRSSDWRAAITCQDCHVVPSTAGQPGHIDALPAELTWGAKAQTRGATPTWNGTTCAGAYCHGGALDGGGGSNTQPVWTAVNGTQAACGTCHGLPPGGGHPPSTQCNLCHGAVIAADGGWVNAALHINGLVEQAAQCGSCHALPPATGAHLVHAGLASPEYGALGTAANLSSPTGYAYGCGHCHPMDSAKHMSGGRADIELANPAAPSGSLKARSPAGQYTPGGTTMTDATGLPYTLGTCTNVYCHSVSSYSTPSGVPAAGVDFAFNGYPVVFPPFVLTTSRSFASPSWGGPNPGCGGCHGTPVRTNWVQVDAMAGQSHSALDEQGHEGGHGWNHGYTPLSCRTCHAQTVAQANATSRTDAGVSVYGPVPIAGYGLHVNGWPDIAFDAVNPLPYPSPRTLASASWNSSTKTCSNVSCHLAQTTVQHGTPQHDQVTIECNVCHQY